MVLPGRDLRFLGFLLVGFIWYGCWFFVLGVLVYFGFLWWGCWFILVYFGFGLFWFIPALFWFIPALFWFILVYSLVRRGFFWGVGPRFCGL